MTNEIHDEIARRANTEAHGAAEPQSKLLVNFCGLVDKTQFTADAENTEKTAERREGENKKVENTHFFSLRCLSVHCVSAVNWVFQ